MDKSHTYKSFFCTFLLSVNENNNEFNEGVLTTYKFNDKEVTQGNNIPKFSSQFVLNNAEVTLTMTDFVEDNYEIASNVTVTDANGNADYEVSSTNEAVLTVTKNENGIVVKLVGVGTATLKISYNDCSKDIVVIIE